jgi:hypothetical protein
MYRPSNRAYLFLPIVAVLALAAGAATVLLFSYQSSGPRAARDYEECADEARTNASSETEYSELITRCSVRFAGRRKAGGGYAYFDFLQNKTFDIAGPNPTESEHRQIEHSYMEYLGATGREMFLADLAKAQANLEQAGSDRARQNAGTPLALSPRIPLPTKRPTVERSKPCEDGSLSCGWAKFSAAVRGAFAASPGTSR